MADPSELLKKLLPATVVEKAYDDTAAGAAKEAGKAFLDVIKTARLFLAPLQLAAAFQDRFARLVHRIASEVPAERLVEAPAELVGPSLQQMQFLEEGNPLWQMFENLLKCSIDKEHLSKAHPSFPHLISQLSRDEAIILYHLRDRDFQLVDTFDLDRARSVFTNRKIETSGVPSDQLIVPDQLFLYYSHLESLSLVTWPIKREEPIKDSAGEQTGTRRYSSMKLTNFGRLFVGACVPKSGFNI